MGRVAFVSYCREDHAHVETLKDRLTQLGFDVWLDKNLRGGQEWWNVASSTNHERVMRGVRHDHLRRLTQVSRLRS